MIKNRIFIGNINKCIKFRKNVYGEFKGLGIIDQYGSMEIDSELFQKDVILVEVEEDKYVDFNYFVSYKNFKTIVECISTKTPLENVILNTFETNEGSLFVDPTSLKSFEQIQQVTHNVLLKNLKKQATIL